MSWIDKYYTHPDWVKLMGNCHIFDMRSVNLKEQGQLLASTIVAMTEERMFRPPYPDTLLRIDPKLIDPTTNADEFIIVIHPHLYEEDTIVFGSRYYYSTTNKVYEEDIHFIDEGSGYVDRTNTDMKKREPVNRSNAAINCYLTALCLIYSRSIEKESVVISEALNSKREKQNKPRLQDYHIVKLPNQFRYANDTEELPPEERRYVRAHWRRGHIRHQPTNRGIRKLFIAPVLVCGDREFVAKHYEFKRAA